MEIERTEGLQYSYANVDGVPDMLCNAPKETAAEGFTVINEKSSLA